MPAGEADTSGVTPGRKARVFPLFSCSGITPEAVPGTAGDVSAATEALGVGVPVALGTTDGAVIGVDVGNGVAFSPARGLIAGDLIGTVPCFSSSRATLLNFPRSRTGVGELGVAVACGSPTAPRFEGEVGAAGLAVACGASVDPGGDVGAVIGAAAVARGVNVGCGMGVDLSAVGGGDVGAEVAVGLTGGVAVGVVDGVVAATELASVARTKLFGGASRGGVASDLIFARACSASRWLLIAAQPKSTVAWPIVSLMVRGRSLGRAGAITGAGISTTSPRTIARASFACTLLCRSRRRRLMGVRVRNSS